MISMVYYSAQAAMTKYHRLSYLHNRHFCSHNSGGWRSEIKVPTGLISGEASLWPADGHCLPVSFPLCVHGERERKRERTEGGRVRDTYKAVHNTCNGQEVKTLSTAFKSHRMEETTTGQQQDKLLWGGRRRGVLINNLNLELKH